MGKEGVLAMRPGGQARPGGGDQNFCFGWLLKGIVDVAAVVCLFVVIVCRVCCLVVVVLLTWRA